MMMNNSGSSNIIGGSAAVNGMLSGSPGHAHRDRTDRSNNNSNNNNSTNNTNNSTNNSNSSDVGGFFNRIRSGAGSVVPRPFPGRIAKTKGEPATDEAGRRSVGSDGVLYTESGELGEEDGVNDSGARKSLRETQFDTLLNQENVDLTKLRKLSWNGIPRSLRPTVWQMLLGYIPTNKARRSSAITRKRKEYHCCVDVYFSVAESVRSAQEAETIVQILKDLHRCRPDSPFFQQQRIQKAMERILYIWSIRHPASGYVQGMDDLLTPLLYIAMQPYCTGDVLRMDVGSLDPAIIADVEADSYWCLSKLLDNIQDHYTFSQPGIQRMLLRLEDLVHRIDSTLHDHFQDESLQYFQFSFRWMNCLLLREIPLNAVIRLWDTYMAEPTGGFENFHVYVCAVLLKTFKDDLMSMQFQELLMFLQELPTTDWTEDQIEPILSQAYILSTLFDSSPSHLG
jgi:hypothetical protein